MTNTSPRRGVAATGIGVALPETIVTNTDLESRLDTSDQWIVERSGIRERRIGGTTAGLGAQAAAAALDDAGLRPSDIDLLVVCTETPDKVMPPTSGLIAGQLGIRSGALDLNAACAGFAYGWIMACGLVEAGADRVLLVGSDTMSTITDQADRSTAVLFADGAGACVLEGSASEAGLLGWDAGTDGSLAGILACELGAKITMEGRAVFKQAVRVVVESCSAALERAKLAPSDVDLFVPHQANIRIVDAVASRLGIPAERWATVLDTTGNTGAASIAIALADARSKGRLDDGSVVLLSGFGAGMTWATAVVRWSYR